MYKSKFKDEVRLWEINLGEVRYGIRWELLGILGSQRSTALSPELLRWGDKRPVKRTDDRGASRNGRAKEREECADLSSEYF